MTRAKIITCILVAAGVALSVFLSIRNFGWPIALLAGPVLFGAGWLMAAIFVWRLAKKLSDARAKPHEMKKAPQEGGAARSFNYVQGLR
jgi:hypothetical protein